MPEGSSATGALAPGPDVTNKQTKRVSYKGKYLLLKVLSCENG
jgi:hypothetical protein